MNPGKKNKKQTAPTFLKVPPPPCWTLPRGCTQRPSCSPCTTWWSESRRTCPCWWCTGGRRGRPPGPWSRHGWVLEVKKGQNFECRFSFAKLSYICLSIGFHSCSCDTWKYMIGNRAGHFRYFWIFSLIKNVINLIKNAKNNFLLQKKIKIPKVPSSGWKWHIRKIR